MQMFGVRDPNGQILAVGYEPVNGILRIRWKKGEGEHSGVPEKVFVSIRKVPFAYSYYQKTVKGKYPYTKIEDPPVVEPPQKETRSMEVYLPQDGVTFVEDDHTYFLNGTRIPFSLTQVLELSGLSRKPSSAQEVAARPAAAKRGTLVHQYSDWDDRGELDLDDLKAYPEYYNRVVGWRQFREDFHFEPDLTVCEVPMAVKLNGMLYAMKLDAFGVIGEGDNIALAVVEKKCTANEESSHAIQTAAQAIAFKQRGETLQMPVKRFVVYLTDKANASERYYRVVECTDRNDEKVFVGAGLMNVYYRHQKGLLK